MQGSPASQGQVRCHCLVCDDEIFWSERTDKLYCTVACRSKAWSRADRAEKRGNTDSVWEQIQDFLVGTDLPAIGYALEITHPAYHHRTMDVCFPEAGRRTKRAPDASGRVRLRSTPYFLVTPFEAPRVPVVGDYRLILFLQGGERRVTNQVIRVGGAFPSVRFYDDKGRYDIAGNLVQKQVRNPTPKGRSMRAPRHTTQQRARTASMDKENGMLPIDRELRVQIRRKTKQNAELSERIVELEKQLAAQAAHVRHTAPAQRQVEGRQPAASRSGVAEPQSGARGPSAARSQDFAGVVESLRKERDALAAALAKENREREETDNEEVKQLRIALLNATYELSEIKEQRAAMPSSWSAANDSTPMPKRSAPAGSMDLLRKGHDELAAALSKAKMEHQPAPAFTGQPGTAGTSDSIGKDAAGGADGLRREPDELAAALTQASQEAAAGESAEVMQLRIDLLNATYELSEIKEQQAAAASSTSAARSSTPNASESAAHIPSAREVAALDAMAAKVAQVERERGVLAASVAKFAELQRERDELAVKLAQKERAERIVALSDASQDSQPDTMTPGPLPPSKRKLTLVTYASHVLPKESGPKSPNAPKKW